MKRIIFIIIAGLAFFATAAAAYQVNWRQDNTGNQSTVQDVNYTGNDCPMNTGKGGRGMMGFGMETDTAPAAPVHNRLVHPSSRVQAGTVGTDK